MTKREAKIIAMRMVGMTIDQLLQGDWRFEYPEKDSEKICEVLKSIEMKFLTYK